MRKTLAKEFSIEGTGLHKGEKSSLKVLPSSKDEGINFVFQGVRIKADIANISSTVRGTNLKKGDSVIYTVEHLLSALFAMDIDDAEIIMSSFEPPAVDGSALPFARLISEAGLTCKNQPGKPVFTAKNKLTFSHKESSYEIVPCEKFELETVYENAHPLIGRQVFSCGINPKEYVEQIAPARTFGFKREIDYLIKNGLALGGSLDNAVVLDGEKVLNPSGLRYKDEFARHKALDLLGDLALAGFRFEKIRISACRPSHEANAAFAAFLKGEFK